MESRDDLLANKKAEIASLIERTLSGELEEKVLNTKDIMKQLFESGGLSMTPPQQESLRMNYITLDSLKNFNKGQSIKAGNIRLNIRRFIDYLPDMVSATVEVATDIPILKVCAALNIWKLLRNVLTVEITKEQAIVIIALWENCDQRQRISLEQGFACVSALYEQIEKTECVWEHYIKIINDLEKIYSLELDDEGIWLREWISKAYID